MAIIEKEVELVGSKGKEKVTGLFDSGATYSCIEKELAQQLEMIIPLPMPLPFETAKKGEEVEAEEAVRLDFYLDGYRFSDEFFVLPDLSEKLIIGTTTMQKWRFKLDFEREEVIIDPRVTRLRLLKAVETESEMMLEKKELIPRGTSVQNVSNATYTAFELKEMSNTLTRIEEIL